MSDVMMPTNLSVAKVSFRYIDNTGVSRGMFTRRLRVASFGGDTLGASIQLSPHGGASSKGQMERAQLRAWLASLQGPQNPTYLYDPSYRMRGSFPTGELLTNNTFENGTTGWMADSRASLSVADHVLRVTRTMMDGAECHISGPFVTLDAYTPYVMRGMWMQGRGSFTTTGPGWVSADAAQYGSSVIPAYGMKTFAIVPLSTSFQPEIVDAQGFGQIPGDFFLVPYMSLSRCALVDAGQNLALWSDQIDNAVWVSTNATVNVNQARAPDGTVTAETLQEDASLGLHYLTQLSLPISSSAVDVCFAGAFRGEERTWCWLNVGEDDGNTEAVSYFNLATGAVGTSSVGANWTHLRAYTVPMGNGWHYCCIVVRKTNAATSLTVRAGLAASDGVALYAGDGAARISLWRLTVAQSSVPVRLVQTTGTAELGSSPTGTAMYIKGGPANTTGALLAGDQFEVITSRGSELKIVTAPLNSDAAGLGYLQFTPPLRGTVADNAPIIVHQPMGRFVFTGEAVGWDEEPGFITSASAEFEEA